MRDWSAERIAHEAGADLLAAPRTRTGPERAVIDSRHAGPGALFIGLRGDRVDGGAFAGDARAAGAWGALVRGEHVAAARTAHAGALLAAEDPLHALQRLAAAWRRELGAQVIGITGSTGKTSTKDLLLAVLAAHRRTVASRANFNTEIGLPLEILAAPAGTEVLVLEMAMRGAGQIAELTEIAQPDVGVIVSIGPVHLSLLGTLHAIAAAKAELIAGLRKGAIAIVPSGEPLLAPHLRADIDTVSFGEGGDVSVAQVRGERVEIDLAGERIALEVPFTQEHLRGNLLAAVAAARAVGVTPRGRIEIELSPGRGQRRALARGVTLIDDCYNANPMSMRAALEDLAATVKRDGHRRAIAVLGDMLELGPGEREFHRQIGERASSLGVDLLVTVGPLAGAMRERFTGEAASAADAGEAASLVPELLDEGDVVLVKGSRGVGLELVCHTIAGGRS